MKTNNFTIKSILTLGLFLNMSLLTYAQNGVELGPSTASGDHSIAGGNGSTAAGVASLAIGENAQANGDYSVGLGESTNAIGDRSFAFGFSTNAGGIGSVAGGQASTANGENSIAVGLNNITNSAAYGSLALGTANSTTGPNSIALGENNQSIGGRSIAIGMNNIASGDNSLSIGLGTYANAQGAMAGGTGSQAHGINSIAFGINALTESTAIGSVAMGGASRTIGDGSFAIGQENIAHAFGEMAMGQYCEEYEGYTSYFSNVPTDRLFVLGNGDNSTNRSNAVTILKSGNSGFGVSYPSEDIHVKGGVRVESSTSSPNPKTVYANSMPLAYGSFLFNGAITSDYGITSVSNVSSGVYEITLDNAWIGVPAVNATVRFGGVVGQGITITHEFDVATKKIILYFADANSGAGIDQAFSMVVYGQPTSGTGSGCSPVQSPTSLLQAPNEVGSYYVTEDADCGCITDIPFAFGGPNPNVLITVGGFVGAGTGTVEVDLDVISPNGGGASSASVDLTSAGASVNVGVYTGVYGAVYDTYVDLTYDGTQFVEATVRMVAL